MQHNAHMHARLLKSLYNSQLAEKCDDHLSIHVDNKYYVTVMRNSNLTTETMRVDSY